MKVNYQNDITSILQTEKQIVSQKMELTRKKMTKNKSFLPFLNEKMHLGRLIKIETERKRPKNSIFFHHGDLGLPRKGILSKIYKESLNMISISPTKSDSRIKEGFENNISLGLYSPLKTKISQETPRMIPSNNLYTEQNSKIEQNFERFNNYKNKDLANEKIKKFHSQGTPLKLLSPREEKSQFASPFGIYNVENSKNFIERKSRGCFIIQEHNFRSNQNYRPPSPERTIISYKSITTLDETVSEFKKMMSDLKKQVKSTNLPSKEEIYGKSPFSILSQEIHHLDLMKFNQNVTNKFEDTRIRLHNLKMKINDVTMPSSEEKERKYNIMNY